MEKPTSNLNSGRTRTLHFSIGLVFALSLSLLAFEWAVPYERSYICGLPVPDDPFIIEEMPRITLPEKPSPASNLNKGGAPKPLQPDLATAEVNKTTEEAPANFVADFPKDKLFPDEPVNDPDLPFVDKPYLSSSIMPFLCECSAVGEDSREECTRKKLMMFMGREIRYPEEAKRQRIEGTVYVEFVVNYKGEVDRVKLKNNVHPLLDKEALRVVNALPCYVPGVQGEKNVSVLFTIPINFNLK